MFALFSWLPQVAKYPQCLQVFSFSRFIENFEVTHGLSHSSLRVCHW